MHDPMLELRERQLSSWLTTIAYEPMPNRWSPLMVWAAGHRTRSACGGREDQNDDDDDECGHVADGSPGRALQTSGRRTRRQYSSDPCTQRKDWTSIWSRGARSARSCFTVRHSSRKLA